MPVKPNSGTPRVASGWPALQPLFRLAFGWLVFCVLCGIRPDESLAARSAMHGPSQALARPVAPPGATQATAEHNIFLAPIRFFQRHISPIDGPRCQFSPTCSSFGYQAIHTHGIWIGGMMTTDRLLRCSPLTAAEQYRRLPNGRLADPIANNRGED